MINRPIWKLFYFFSAICFFFKEKILSSRENSLERNHFLLPFLHFVDLVTLQEDFHIFVSHRCVYVCKCYYNKKYFERKSSTDGISVFISTKWCIYLVLYVYRIEKKEERKQFRGEQNDTHRTQVLSSFKPLKADTNCQELRYILCFEMKIFKYFSSFFGKYCFSTQLFPY